MDVAVRSQRATDRSFDIAVKTTTSRSLYPETFESNQTIRRTHCYPSIVLTRNNRDFNLVLRLHWQRAGGTLPLG